MSLLWWTLIQSVCVFIRKYQDTQRDSRDVHEHRGKAKQGHSKKVAVCKPRREAAGKSRLQTPPSWMSSLQNCEKINFCCQATQSELFCCSRPSKLIHISLVQEHRKKSTLPQWLTSNLCHNVERTIYSFGHQFVHLLLDSVNIY